MRASGRIFLVSTFVIGTAILFACSSDDTTDTTGDKSASGGDSGVSNSDTDGSTPTKPGDGKDSATANTCEILNPGAGGPSLEPAACVTCAAEKCCAPITKCFTGTPVPVESGLPGADGKKTACELFYECELACDDGDEDAGAACMDTCETTYGAEAVQAWEEAGEGCIWAPSGCGSFCP
jgi:hypothetical protein